VTNGRLGVALGATVDGDALEAIDGDGGPEQPPLSKVTRTIVRKAADRRVVVCIPATRHA
jgi:hypothetical protein